MRNLLDECGWLRGEDCPSCGPVPWQAQLLAIAWRLTRFGLSAGFGILLGSWLLYLAAECAAYLISLGP